MNGVGLYVDYGDYYFATICAPAVIIALFVCYVFLKDRHKRS